MNGTLVLIISIVVGILVFWVYDTFFGNKR